MLQFLKGQGTAQYFELIELNSDYRDALFLDTESKRLFYDGQSTDIRISVITEIDDDYKNKVSYQFTNPSGDTTVIKDSVIPEIEDFKMTLHDMEDGTDFTYSNGLQSVKDKFLLETMAKLMGFTLSYVYYANVNHIKDRMNNDIETMTDVIVYLNENDEWVYEYESFTYNKYIKIGSEYQYIGQEPYPGGFEVVPVEKVRLQSIKTVLKAGLQVKYDGGDLRNDTSTLSKHGGVAAGTTVAELEQKTLSEVISNILFETARPIKVCDTSAYIKFSPDYVSESETQYVDVGQIYPGKEDINLVFTPETWQNVIDGSLDCSVGAPQVIVELDEENTKYYINDEQHPWTGGHGKAPDNIYDMSEAGYAEHHDEFTIEENDKSTYYVIVKYNVTKYPVDTNDSSVYINEDEEEVPYRDENSDEEVPVVKVFDSSTMVTNILHMDGTPSTETIKCNIVAAWRVASNAAIMSNKSFWNNRYVEPDDFAGNDEITLSDYFAYDGAVLYAQWNSALTLEDKLYVYLPVGYNIANIGSAHDALVDNWDGKISFEKVIDASLDEPVVVNIENQYEAVRDYNKFEIHRALGITNVKFTIEKVNEE